MFRRGPGLPRSRIGNVVVVREIGMGGRGRSLLMSPCSSCRFGGRRSPLHLTGVSNGEARIPVPLLFSDPPLMSSVKRSKLIAERCRGLDPPFVKSHCMFSVFGVEENIRTDLKGKAMGRVGHAVDKGGRGVRAVPNATTGVSTPKHFATRFKKHVVGDIEWETPKFLWFEISERPHLSRA